MRAMTAQRLLVALCFLWMVFVVRSFAQEGGQFIDKSRIPAEGNSVKDFIPPGWIIEDQVLGDLNNDSLPDVALKLIQDKASKENDEPEDRRRALVILFRSKDGRFFSRRSLTGCCNAPVVVVPSTGSSKRRRMSKSRKVF